MSCEDVKCQVWSKFNLGNCYIMFTALVFAILEKKILNSVV